MRSVRTQILALLAAALLLGLGSYFLLATRLYTADTLAYIYDLESSLTAMVSEELRESLGSRVDKLGYFAAAAASGDADRAAGLLLASDPDLLSLEIWGPRQGRFQRTFRRADAGRLASVNLSEAELAEARRTTPVPFEAVAVEGALLQNASLPPDVALLSLAAAPPGAGGVVVVILKPDRLLRIFARSAAYQIYLVDGRGGIVIHPDPAPVTARASAASSGIVRDATRGGLSRGVREFEGPDGPTIGAFARVGLGRLAVVAEVPRAAALRATRTLARRSVLFALGILFLAVLASVYLGRRLTAPLRRLEEATRAVASGEFGAQVPVEGRNEIARLAEAFNRMGAELGDREARLTEAHTQLAQAEKLSAVGELAASVVHEVKNPVAAIVGYAQIGGETPELAEAKELFKLVEGHAWRANDVLQTILAYARMEKGAQTRLDPSALARGTLKMLHHQLLLNTIRVQQDLPEGLPRILGNANQLQQVLVNLMMNAAQAMEGRPDRVLTLGAAERGDSVVIRVQDTGVGIPPEDRQRIFTPFFSTKPPGKGTGLGLSVSRRIVGQHRGEICVESEPGRGTTFSVVLPRAEIAEAAAASEAAEKSAAG